MQVIQDIWLAKLKLTKDSPDPYVWELLDKVDIAIEKLQELQEEMNKKSKCK